MEEAAGEGGWSRGDRVGGGRWCGREGGGSDYSLICQTGLSLSKQGGNFRRLEQDVPDILSRTVTRFGDQV